MKQGCEPPTFTCHFLGWNPNLWAQDKSYEAYRRQVSEGVTAVAEELKKYDESCKFKYEELKGKDKCPTGVDPSRKEVLFMVDLGNHESFHHKCGHNKSSVV